jgi:hypothetical protein
MRHVGRLSGVVIGTLVLGCSSALDDHRCTHDGSSSLSSSLDPGADCNGANHANECAWSGLPSAYGVEKGCERPAMWTDGAACHGRARGLAGCVPLGLLLCCPE